MQRHKIAILGHICIDHNTSENATYTGWGSSALYMNKVFRDQYASSPTIITTYGPDIAPYLPPATLLPARPSKPHTLIYKNDSRQSNGKRVQQCEHVSSADEPSLSKEALATLQAADILIVAPLLPNYSAKFITRALAQRKHGSLALLCPQGYFRKIKANGFVQPRAFAEAPQIVPQFDLVVYSEEDHPDSFGLANTWKQAAPNTHIVVTQSAAGASIVGTRGARRIPTKALTRSQIVDSVGCGDTFAATVAYEYRQSGDLPAAIRLGHQAARKKMLTTPG